MAIPQSIWDKNITVWAPTVENIEATDSVTRFGEISPLWLKFTSLCEKC